MKITKPEIGAIYRVAQIQMACTKMQEQQDIGVRIEMYEGDGFKAVRIVDTAADDVVGIRRFPPSLTENAERYYLDCIGEDGGMYPGKPITYGEFNGQVIERYSGGMFNVRLPGGTACVCGSGLKPRKAREMMA